MTTLPARRCASSFGPGSGGLDTGYDAIPRQAVPATPTERRVGFAEVEIGYDEAQARLEATALPCAASTT